MSLMTVSKASADLRTISACSRWAAVISLSRSSDVMPITPFIGVRIS